jgi:hypothetical protein
MDEEIEHTLHVNRDVKVYRIPPRPASTGHISGNWRVADQIFAGGHVFVQQQTLCGATVRSLQASQVYASMLAATAAIGAAAVLSAFTNGQSVAAGVALKAFAHSKCTIWRC